MNISIMIFIVGLSIFPIIGCNKNAVSATGSGNLQLQSLTATPKVVPAGSTAMIICNVSSNTSGKLNYEWNASGAYGYLTPMDSICIFSTPTCHSGRATVTVKVSNASGESISGSVNLN